MDRVSKQLSRVGAAAAVLLAMQVPAQAQVYKCAAPNGRVSLQQTPCEGGGGAQIKVSPASGHDAGPSTPATASGKSFTEQLADERVQRERWERLNNAKLAVDRQRAECSREQTEIAARKRVTTTTTSIATTPLADAARDNAISGEMQAAATLCVGRVQQLDSEVNRAQSECDRLGCRQPGT